MFNFKTLKAKGRETLRRKLNRNLASTVANSKMSIITETTTSELYERNRSRRVAFLKGGVIKREMKKKVSKGNIKSGWGFSSISLSSNGRIDVACELLLEAYNILNQEQKKSVDENYLRAAIRSFILEISKNYPNSAFHNFAHAVDVAQLMYASVQAYFQYRVRKPELFYLVVAALCHDLGHIGVTTRTLRKLEVLEEGETLEDFHIAETMKIFENPKLSLLSSNILENKYKVELERYSRHLIEATDINQCKRFLQEAKNVSIKPDALLPIEYLAVLMKVSDLANVTRDFCDSSVWGERLKIEMKAEEMFNKDYEIPSFLSKHEKLDLVRQEVFVLQRRIKSNEYELYKGLASNTIRFMEFAVVPIFDVLPQICPVYAKDYMNRVKSNESRWRMLN